MDLTCVVYRMKNWVNRYTLAITTINRFTTLILLHLFITTVCSCKEDEVQQQKPVLEIKAVDGSMIADLLENEIQFKNEDKEVEDLFNILKNNGVNTVRLRIWHSPGTNNSSLQQVSSTAKLLRSEGFKIWLCVHYSDTWADPSHQIKPKAWDSLETTKLALESAKYTFSVVQTIQPDIIQIGNEINNGLLHPEGNLHNSPSDFLTILNGCLTSAKNAKADVQTMLHIAGPRETLQMLDNIALPEFDMLGISYYPK